MSDVNDDSAVRVTLLFFGKARELVGISRIEVDDLVGISAEYSGTKLLQTLVAAFPALDPIRNSIILAHNLEYVEGDQTVRLRTGDEIAVIPPVSGG